MRFAHTADCHIGGHRNPRLRALTEQAFQHFITESLAAQVDFILIAGDLFNTAIPGIETLKFTVDQLKRCTMPIYAIPGSHDYSPSGKTMLNVLEKAGLLVNVFKGVVTNGTLTLSYTTDPTGVQITGIPGMRGMLDKQLYERLELPTASGDSIFLFHTAITELVNIPGSQPLTMLPAGCTYYAGGHVHAAQEQHLNKYHIAYPGPLFPNTFAELEELKYGSYLLYDNGYVIRKKIALKPVKAQTLDMTGTTVDTIAKQLDTNVRDTIVLLRIVGTVDGPLDLRPLVRALEAQTPYTILTNTAQLSTTAFTPSEIQEAIDIEATLLEEHKEQLTLPNKDGATIAKTLLRVLAREQKDGEKVYEYKDAVVKEALDVLTPS